MKILVAFALIASVSAFEKIELDYHNAFGVPEATRIKNAEAAMDFDGSRITGGSMSALGKFPHFGGLVITLTDGRTSVCGSSLISNTRATTAAHCWRTNRSRGRRLTIVLESTKLFSGGTRINTSNVQMHRSYNMTSLNNDVAIIFINWVNFGTNINPIKLATGSDLYVGTWAVACGFGATHDGGGGIPQNQVLSHVSLQVMTNAMCQEIYGAEYVIESTLCVATSNGQSTCGGDSGGPLAFDNTMIGIVSFGSVWGCTRGFPIGFARVTSFASWFQARL